MPNVDLDGPVEIDIAALRERSAADESAAGSEAALWAPPAPGLTATLDFADLDLIEVQVFYEEDGPQLMAAIELVSPSNKDRPSERRAFALKCVSYLHEGCAVVVVDAVTSWRANLHAEIWRLLELDEGQSWQSPTNLYAVAYRAVSAAEGRRLEAWPQPLTLGGPLPRVPLWLGVDICVPLDLEASYLATCSDLRIRLAS